MMATLLQNLAKVMPTVDPELVQAKTYGKTAYYKSNPNANYKDLSNKKDTTKQKGISSTC